MIHRFQTLLVGAKLIGLLAILPASANAAVTLVLNDPNPTVVIPSSGSITLTFTGTLSIGQGFYWSGTTLHYPFVDAGVFPPGLTSGVILAAASNANNGGTLTDEPMFSFDISSTDLPGLYDENFAGGPVTFVVNAENRDTGEQVSAEVPYTINLVAEPVTVPESSPWAVAGLLFVATAGFRSWRRRR